MALRLIAKGAEADLWLDPDWNGRRAVIKRRVEKRYRHREIDRELRRLRTLREAEIIHRAKRAGVPTPVIYQVDPEEATMVMEHIEGRRLRDVVAELSPEERLRIFRMAGLQAGRLHRAGIIHGDLTTSNMILTPNRLVFVDFGLAELSTEEEKRGVDLHLMRRMLQSTHFQYAGELLKAFLEGYREEMGEEADGVFRRMEEIARRGRYVER
ncbi:MAG: p53-regulating protein kinase [Candidatus Bathyarchaeota archaeon B23]|nr:MAG: p53-regulating protein kinase [Candidatus Bathyarchaeota archaeon B23]